MTSKSHALGASIGWRRDTLFCLCATIVGIILIQGCSIAPDDAAAATDSAAADSAKQVVVEKTVAPPDVEDAQNNLDNVRDESSDPSDPGENRDTANEGDRTDEVTTIERTGSTQTTNKPIEDSRKDPPKQIVDSQKTYELTFDDLAFEMEKTEKFKRSMLTAKINEYDGSTIRLRGFIRPSFSQSGLTKFVFVRDNKECCFGPGAALYDCVLVRLAKGKKTEYTVRPVTIEGKFYLKEYKGPDGKVWSIYRMKEAFVR